MLRNLRRKLRIFGIVLAAIALLGLIRGQFAMHVGNDRRVITRGDDPRTFWAVEGGAALLAAACFVGSF